MTFETFVQTSETILSNSLSTKVVKTRETFNETTQTSKSLSPLSQYFNYYICSPLSPSQISVKLKN